MMLAAAGMAIAPVAANAASSLSIAPAAALDGRRQLTSRTTTTTMTAVDRGHPRRGSGRPDRRGGDLGQQRRATDPAARKPNRAAASRPPLTPGSSGQFRPVEPFQLAERERAAVGRAHGHRPPPAAGSAGRPAPDCWACRKSIFRPIAGARSAPAAAPGPCRSAGRRPCGGRPDRARAAICRARPAGRAGSTGCCGRSRASTGIPRNGRGR